MNATANIADVARILNLINNPPNQRDHPTTSDLQGDYTKWFDGGAIRVDTGSTKYLFMDGTTVLIQTLIGSPIIIRFPDGTKSLSQKSKSD